ncbi:MAG: hypothetical protein HY791_18770 [Deltaproteobacteria bacterium]|nr:hypothetical protein [Deltaproteobacteria bacterium]
MNDVPVQVKHVYSHDKGEFEANVNAALAEIFANDCMLGDIKYSIDPSTDKNAKGGFGALIIFERPMEGDEDEE